MRQTFSVPLFESDVGYFCLKKKTKIRKKDQK